MKEDLKQIMSLSLPFCKNGDPVAAGYFQRINSLAHEAEVYLNKKPYYRGIVHEDPNKKSE